MFSIQLLVSFLFVLWIYFLWSRRRFYRLMLQIPGPMGYPLTGNLHRFGSKSAALTEFGLQMKRWGSTFLGWFGPIPVLVVSDPQLIQVILTSPHTVNKAFLYNVIREIVGKGLVVLKDALWTTHRKALNPAFGQNILLSFLPIFNNESGSLIQELDALVGQGENNLLPLFKNYTLRIATQTTLGSDVKKEEVYQNNTMIKCYERIFEIGTEMTRSPWLNSKLMRHWTGMEKHLNEANATIRKVIKKLVDRKLAKDAEQIAITENKSNIFISLTTDQLKSGVFSYQDVVDECHTIVAAAFETTAITITYTLIQLAMFPEYQEKLFEEIKSVFPTSGDFEVTYEEVQKLEYLDMVLNESMRVMPAFPFIARQISRDLKLENGTVLPRRLQIIISIYHLHRSKDIWGPHADTFNPENCSPQKLRDKHPYSFIPFSKGKRNCIGWKYGLISLKVALTKILRNFKLSTMFRPEDLWIVNNISLKFKEMPLFELKHRN